MPLRRLAILTAVVALSGCASTDTTDETASAEGATSMTDRRAPATDKLQAAFDQATVTITGGVYLNQGWTVDHNNTRCGAYADAEANAGKQLPEGDVYTVDAKAISGVVSGDQRGYDIRVRNAKTKTGAVGARPAFRIMCMWWSDVAPMEPDEVARSLAYGYLTSAGPKLPK